MCAITEKASGTCEGYYYYIFIITNNSEIMKLRGLDNNDTFRGFIRHAVMGMSLLLILIKGSH